MDLTQSQWAGAMASDPDAILLDVRTPEEWAEGIIPGAMLLDIHSGAEFMAGIQLLDKGKNYYVYCKAGGRSRQACEIMHMTGIGSTYNLLGGFSHWEGESVIPDL